MSGLEVGAFRNGEQHEQEQTPSGANLLEVSGDSSLTKGTPGKSWLQCQALTFAGIFDFWPHKDAILSGSPQNEDVR